MTEKLKPCPFCGGEAELNKTEAKNIFPYRVSHACHAIGNGIVTTGCVSPEEAIKAWNNRAGRTCQIIKPKKLPYLDKEMMCSECGRLWLEKGVDNYCPSCGAKVVD